MAKRNIHFDEFLTLARRSRGLKAKISLLIILAGFTAAAGMYFSPSGYSPPAVAISLPTNGTAFIAPAKIAIYASASDVRGRITRVDFYLDSRLLGTDTSRPYKFTWNTATAGEYGLTAVATNNSGISTASPPVYIAVRNISPTGCTCGDGCAERTAISPPFTFDGEGEFCWEATSLGRFIFSSKLDTLEINGVNLRNLSTNRFPPKINGKYFIYYRSSNPFGRFDMN